MTEEEEGEEEEEASLASVPSTKTNNLLMERSGTEEEELTLTMEWKTGAVSYTHLTLPTNTVTCRSRWSPYH